MNHVIISLLSVLFLAGRANCQELEPGPESGGLRLRMAVESNFQDGGDTFNVRLDLINVTDHDIVLKAEWPHEGNEGDVSDFIEAATSIETVPPIAPWTGQVLAPNRRSSQPQHTLKSGEALVVDWSTNERRLKSKVTNPNSVQNPEFPVDGLYSVHAKLQINAGDQPVLLRSNEQLVSVGGSTKAPKHTCGQIQRVDMEKDWASLGLGSLHQVELGDEFQIRTGMREFWKLKITHVAPEFSEGTLEPLLEVWSMEMSSTPRPPEPQMSATLILN